MPSQYSLYGQSSSRIYENGKEKVSKDTIIATDGRKARVIARDDNIVKYAELNKKDVKNLLKQHPNKKSLIENLEKLLPKAKKLTKKRRKRNKRRTKRRKKKSNSSWF